MEDTWPSVSCSVLREGPRRPGHSVQIIGAPKKLMAKKLWEILIGIFIWDFHMEILDVLDFPIFVVGFVK